MRMSKQIITSHGYLTIALNGSLKTLDSNVFTSNKFMCIRVQSKETIYVCAFASFAVRYNENIHPPWY